MNPAQLDKSSVVAPESADGGALGRRSGRGSSVVVADGVVGRHSGRGVVGRSSGRGSSAFAADGGRRPSQRTGVVGRQSGRGRRSSERTEAVRRPIGRVASDGQIRPPERRFATAQDRTARSGRRSASPIRSGPLWYLSSLGQVADGYKVGRLFHSSSLQLSFHRKHCRVGRAAVASGASCSYMVESWGHTTFITGTLFIFTKAETFCGTRLE